MNVFGKLKEGLNKTRSQIATIVGKAVFDDSFYDTIEEALISADIGMDLSLEIIDEMKDAIARQGITDAKEAYDLMKKIIADSLHVVQFPDEFPPKPWTVLVVGVNGVGKTTTIGKLCHEYTREGKDVVLGAADTFRAGAVEQLRIWAQRNNAGFVSQDIGADPASVAFDALEAAQSRGSDVLLLDTAGRLHTKANLMNELQKIVRVLRRKAAHVPNEILLVIDATTGQNALRQARVFNDALGLTGLIITKLDGTAKGGIAVALTKELNIPIRKIGVGEGIEDLQDFDPQAYVDAMFGDIK
ncbi:MAG: signal recognition particle-docking protein FtsY [Chitinivibrionales bacterium]|nr:signal recognition particle-docking protein FtsY [Chitinivibrionales bacterium]